jgi:hypothetical protein
VMEFTCKRTAQTANNSYQFSIWWSFFLCYQI